MDTLAHIPGFSSIHKSSNNKNPTDQDIPEFPHNAAGKIPLPKRSSNEYSKDFNLKNDSPISPRLKFRDKLIHTTAPISGVNDTNANNNNDSGNLNRLNSSSMGISNSMNNVLPQLLNHNKRVSSKSSGISVAVAIPTLRPSIGLYTPNQKQRFPLSRINTLYGDGSDVESDTENSYIHEEEEDEDDDTDDEHDKTNYNDVSTSDNSSINYSSRTNSQYTRSNDYGNITNEDIPSERNYYNDGAILEDNKRMSNSHVLERNKRDSGYINDEIVTPRSASSKSNNRFASPDFVDNRFFISETEDLLNNRKKLMGELHINSNFDPLINNNSTLDTEKDNNSENDYLPEKMPVFNDHFTRQELKSQNSDMSVLNRKSPISNITKPKLHSNEKNQDSTDTNNNGIYLMQKHTNLTMRHYTKIANRAKHVGSYLTTYYAYVNEYQKIHHFNADGTAEYPNVDGIWNPLQIMRNRRVRMHKGEKLKHFAVHGKKVGVADLDNLNQRMEENGISVVTTRTTTSLPTANFISGGDSNDNSKQYDVTANQSYNGLGILTDQNNQDELLFHHDWRKVKVASRIFSRHVKHRLIWQIGLHEIIGDILWREEKWSDLRDKSGRRWFPKYASKLTVEHKSHNSKSSKGSSEISDTDNIDVGDTKFKKIHELLYSNDTTNNGIKNGKEGKNSDNSSKNGKTKKQERDNDKDSKEFEKDKAKNKSSNNKESTEPKDKEKDRAGSLRRKSDNLASVARFEHYKKRGKCSSIESSTMPVIRIEKSNGGLNVAGHSSSDDNNGTPVPSIMGGHSNSGSISGVNLGVPSVNSNGLNNGGSCPSVISDYIDDKSILEYMNFENGNIALEGQVEVDMFKFIVKENVMYDDLNRGGLKLESKLKEIEKFENESIEKYNKLLKMIEDSEKQIEKHRSFTGLKANKIEELLGYCDRTNGEINTSVTLKIRNLTECSENIILKSENKIISECFYKFIETMIVGVLWFIWIVVEMWLCCKWSVKTIIGIVKWVLI